MAEPAASRASRSHERPVTIELSQAQLERVLHEATGHETSSLSLLAAPELRSVVVRAPGLLTDSSLSRSLLLGLLLLASFPADGSYMANADLAQALRLSASTTHRYVSTLLEVGLLERDPVSRKYRRTDVG